MQVRVDHLKETKKRQQPAKRWTPKKPQPQPSSVEVPAAPITLLTWFTLEANRPETPTNQSHLH